MFDINKAEPYIKEQIVGHPLFSFYRIVDVETYTVYDWQNGRLIPQPQRCYNVWKRETACQNCISRLASSENRQIVKMEMLDDRVFLIQSMPLHELGPNMAMELIQDVTDSLLINNPDENVNVVLNDLVRQLNDLVTHDPYTGLYNKRYAEHELSRAILEWQENDPFSIIIFDLDHFKSVNDTYGHLSGDDVIKAFSGLLLDKVSQTEEWACRLGGDEFMLLCKGADYAQASDIAGQLKQELSDITFRSGDAQFHVSISTGIAQYRPQTGGWKDLFRQADIAMYRDKQMD